MGDLEEVHVSAFVPKGHTVTLIGSDELRLLRAENKVLREIAESLALHEACDLEDEYGFTARVQKLLNGERKEV